MKNKHSIIFKIIFFLVAIFPITILIYAGISYNEEKNNSITSITELNWYYDDNSETKEINKFPITIPTKKNEYREIYARFPSDCKDIQTIAILSIYQKLDIYIDDELIYKYDTDSIRPYGKADPTHFHIVQLPEDIENKVIRIAIKSPYAKHSGYFSHIELGRTDDLIRDIYDSYMPQLVVSVLLLFVNIIVILMLVLFFKTKVDVYKLLLLFMSSLFASLWLIGESEMVNLTLNNFVASQLSYISLMLFAVFFALYLHRDCRKDKGKCIFNYYFIFSLILLTTNCILQITNVFDLYETNYVTYLLIIFEVVTYLIILINRYVKKYREQKIEKYDLGYIISTSLFFVAILIEIVAYNIFADTPHYISSIAFILYVSYVYSITVLRIIDQADKSNEFEVQLKETRNYLAQSQMRPHFIFNTLGAIRTMIMTSPKEAYDMITNFSKYLRANITSIEPRERILFSQELDHIKVYANIEQQRFKNRLTVEYDIKVQNFFIPPLTVEPLVENAVKHGVCKKLKGGKVVVRTFEDEDKIYIYVDDNGIGFDVSILDSDSKKDSVGIRYIRLRLEQLAHGELQIESKIGEGTRAAIILNKKDVVKEIEPIK